MTEALIVSNVFLWAVVVVLAVVVVALARQLGILYERVAPAGALALGKGPAVGETAPVVRAERLGGGLEEVGAPSADGRSTLLFFLSSRCPVCKELLPAVRSIARAESSWLRIVLVGDGEREEHERLASAENLGELPFVLSTALGVKWQVAKLPYAALIDPAGRIRAKGLVNTREHVESLFEAHERDVVSIQDFVRQRRAGVEGSPS